MMDPGQLQVKQSQRGLFRQILVASSLLGSVSFPELSGSHPWSILGVLLQARACIWLSVHRAKPLPQPLTSAGQRE